MKLIIDGGWGVYAPQMVAESGILSAGGISREDIKVLLSGPDHEWYWEVFDTVLSNFRTESDEILWINECGDVFLASPEEVEE